MISAAHPDPPPRCPSPPRLHLRSSPPAPRPEPRRPRVVPQTPVAAAREEREEEAAVVSGGFPVPPPRLGRKRPARPPIPEEEGGCGAREADEEPEDVRKGGISAWDRTRRASAAPLGRRSLRASRDSLCLPADEDDDKADHWLLLPRRALAMDEKQLRQDLAGLRFSMNLLDGQGAGSGNVWLSGVVPVDSGAPQPPARQHQPQGSPPPTVPLKSPSAQNPPGGRPASHKGGKENAGGLPGGLSQKDREERLRILRDKQNEERQRKLEELKQQALAAQKFREQKEEERRRRIEQLRERDEGRRQQVEERKRQIWEAERERREAILRKNQEREARIEAKRKNERSSIVFAFGSSTPRMLEPADTGGTFWGSRRATSTTNVMFSSMVGSTGGSSGGGDKTTSSSGLGASQSGVPSTSSTSLSRRSSERELIGGVMAANGIPAGSKKRAVSAHALDRKPGDEEGDGPSRTSPFASYGPSPRARKKTDLMPTIPSPRGTGPESIHHKGRHKSPGRAFSMTRLDQLARPRTYSQHPESTATPTNDTHHHHLVRRTSRELGTRLTIGGAPDRNVSKSTSHLVTVGRSSAQKQVPQERPLRRTDASKSMSHLGASPSQGTMPALVPRLTRAERLRRRAREVGAAAAAASGKVTPPGVARSGDATPSSPSRPLSALSVHSAAGSGVSLRHRPHLPLSPASHGTPLASPTSAPHTRKPRPISIAITGVSSDSAVSPVGTRDIRSSRLTSDNKTRAQSATEKEGGAKPPKVPSAKKSTPKPTDTPSKKTAPTATEKLQATKTATKTSPKVSPVHSPGEPAQPEQITDSSEEKKDEGKEISAKSDMEKSMDGMEKQDEMKPVEGETEESKEDEKKEEKAETEMKKEEQVKKEESKVEEIDISEGKERIEISTEEKEPDKGESSQDVDMTASMIARSRITTEEEAKAALAERRRLAREQAEREAELERQRLEEERRREEERLRLEEEEQRRAEAEQLRLLEEASRLEKERLQQAIEEAQKREKEEQQRREEEAKARAEKEEQERKAREEAEKLRQEMEERLKKEEEERQMRRKRVEAIMLRTRAKAATPTSTPTKGGEEKEDSPSEERKDVQGQQQTTQATEEDQSTQMVLEGAREGQEMTGGSLSSSSEPTTTEGSPSNQGTSPGHQVSSRNDTENTMVNSGANLIMGVNNIDPLQQAVLNNNGGEITRPVEQTNGHRNGMDFGPTSAFTNVDDVRLNNTANNLLDLSDYNSLGGVNLQQTQQLQLSGGGNNAFPYSKQLSHEDTMNSNAHTAMGAPLQPSIPSAPLQSVTGELDTIIPTGSPFQVEDGLSSAKRQDKNATVGDLLS